MPILTLMRRNSTNEPSAGKDIQDNRQRKDCRGSRNSRQRKDCQGIEHEGEGGRKDFLTSF